MSFLDKADLKVVGTRPIRPDGVDKVTGRANFGADMTMPGMLWGKIKRSPHAHARIISINTDKAMALAGVKAVTTRADFPDIPPNKRVLGAAPANLWDLSRNCMAKGKALYEGHAVAAVAAISPAVAEQACELIEVEYEVLPHVMDVEAAMARRRAGIARRHLHLRRRAEADQGVQRRQAGPLCQGRRRGRVRRGRCRGRAALYDAAGAPGLYRAACLRGFGRAGRPVHDLELEPGPVHGARLHRAHRRRRHRRHPGDPGRDRRRLRRQDHRLSRADRLHAVEEIGARGQDRDEPRGGVPGDRPDLGCGGRGQARRQEGWPADRGQGRAQIPVGRVSRARRSTRAACAPLRPTICPMSKPSATTC